MSIDDMFLGQILTLQKTETAVMSARDGAQAKVVGFEKAPTYVRVEWLDGLADLPLPPLGNSRQKDGNYDPADFIPSHRIPTTIAEIEEFLCQD
jgi:hypothetical protein